MFYQHLMFYKDHSGCPLRRSDWSEPSTEAGNGQEMTAVIQVRENGSLDQVVAEEVMIRFWIYFEDRAKGFPFLTDWKQGLKESQG